MGSMHRLRILRPHFNHSCPSNVPSTEVVLRSGSLPSSTFSRLLQCLRCWLNRHEHGLQLRQGGPLHPLSDIRQKRRRGGRADRLRPHQVHGVHILGPHARFQDRTPDLHFPEDDACGTSNRDGDRLRGGSFIVFLVLQGIRCGESKWGIQSAVCYSV